MDDGFVFEGVGVFGVVLTCEFAFPAIGVDAHALNDDLDGEFGTFVAGVVFWLTKGDMVFAIRVLIDYFFLDFLGLGYWVFELEADF